jgi:hypothetical protein
MQTARHHTGGSRPPLRSGGSRAAAARARGALLRPRVGQRARAGDDKGAPTEPQPSRPAPRAVQRPSQVCLDRAGLPATRHGVAHACAACAVPPGTPAAATSPAPSPTPPRQWQRFAGFVRAGDAKEAWLSISATVLRVSLPSAVLAAALHGAVWGGAPPAAVGAAGAAAAAGAAVAGATEVWKMLEGFQG